MKKLKKEVTGLTTPSDVYFMNDNIANRYDNGYPMECHICGKYLYKDDNITRVVTAGDDIVCYDCLKDSFTEEMFWQYLHDEKLTKDFLEWFFEGEDVVISGWSDTIEDALIKGLDPDIESAWLFVDGDIDDFARWAVENEKI